VLKGVKNVIRAVVKHTSSRNTMEGSPIMAMATESFLLFPPERLPAADHKQKHSDQLNYNNTRT
jgi:hypothetical protein